MARLTEEMVIARSKQSDLSSIRKLNCWGAELGDVSLLRRMPNVEVLAFSINKIRSLVDFAGCRALRELYVRKNEIRDLREIRHLRRLPALTSLWLEENPCTLHPEYRLTVLRNLPQLEKLDNVDVQPEELQEAVRRGALIPDSDDEGYSQPQEAYAESVRSGGSSGRCGARPRSTESSPERDEHYEPRLDQCPLSPTRRAPAPDERLEHPAMTRSHYDTRRRADPPLRHSVSAHSVKEYTYASNGECRYGVASPPNQEYYDRDRQEYPPSTPGSAREWERDREPARERDSVSAASVRERDREREYPSAVMAEHRGFTRRPVTRNSNLLSALLCLVKELDYPSLEVAEMAVRCRMDELANSP